MLGEEVRTNRVKLSFKGHKSGSLKYHWAQARLELESNPNSSSNSISIWDLELHSSTEQTQLIYIRKHKNLFTNLFVYSRLRSQIDHVQSVLDGQDCKKTIHAKS